MSINKYICYHESSRTPQHSKMELCGCKQATAQAHVHPHCVCLNLEHTKNSNRSENFPQRRKSNSNLLLNSTTSRNRSNLFRVAWYLNPHDAIAFRANGQSQLITNNCRALAHDVCRLFPFFAPAKVYLQAVTTRHANHLPRRQCGLPGPGENRRYATSPGKCCGPNLPHIRRYDLHMATRRAKRTSGRDVQRIKPLVQLTLNRRKNPAKTPNRNCRLHACLRPDEVRCTSDF